MYEVWDKRGQKFVFRTIPVYSYDITMWKENDIWTDVSLIGNNEINDNIDLFWWWNICSNCW